MLTYQDDPSKHLTNGGIGGIIQTSGYIQVPPQSCPTCGRCPTCGQYKPQAQPQMSWENAAKQVAVAIQGQTNG